MTTTDTPTARINHAVPRGLARTGPVLFSYGFRPFFLGAGLWAAGAMALWIAAMAGRIELAGDYGAGNWHAHEMLFGFAPAILAGFLLTAVPNWTGRLPVSGWPLVGLFSLWCAGRIALMAAGVIGPLAAAVIDGLFLPALLFICAREILAGRKWKDLKILSGLLALSLANGIFHIAALDGDRDHMAIRLAVSAYVVLVMIIGGRIVPSFTRNWLNKAGRIDFPVPFNRYDGIAIVSGIAALAAWTMVPDQQLTAGLALLAAVLHAIRLHRWRGWTVAPEKLLAVLHLAYGFVPLGLLAIALAALGFLEERSALHLLSVGAIGCMMLAVMTRASLGHTGRALTASRLTVSAYASLFLCAIVRPLAEILPDASTAIYTLAGLLWILAFTLFSVEYGPILMRRRRTP